MNYAETIESMIELLKDVEARRSKIFAKGSWTRAEMDSANQAIGDVSRSIADLREKQWKQMKLSGTD